MTEYDQLQLFAQPLDLCTSLTLLINLGIAVIDCLINGPYDKLDVVVYHC